MNVNDFIEFADELKFLQAFRANAEWNFISNMMWLMRLTFDKGGPHELTKDQINLLDKHIKLFSFGFDWEKKPGDEKFTAVLNIFAKAVDKFGNIDNSGITLIETWQDVFDLIDRIEKRERQ